MPATVAPCIKHSFPTEEINACFFSPKTSHRRNLSSGCGSGGGTSDLSGVNTHLLPFTAVLYLQTGSRGTNKRCLEELRREFAEVEESLPRLPRLAGVKKKPKALALSWWAPQLGAMAINPPAREAVSDRPRPLADKSTGPRPDWETHPRGLGCRWVIFPALSLAGWSRAGGYEQAKWNTNAPRFPSEISIIHFHTFPWQHTVGFEGGAGNLNAPAVWKEVSDQQLGRRRRRLLALGWPSQVRFRLGARTVCFSSKCRQSCCSQSLSFFLSFFLSFEPCCTSFGFGVYTVSREKERKEKLLFHVVAFKEIPSLSHFIFINK